MRRLTLIAMVCALVPFGAGIARGEVFGDAQLRVAFGGHFVPKVLPRDRDVPVRVNLNGAIRTPEGVRPPQLRRISFAVNRYGRLSTDGLPTCRAGVIESTDSQFARERCRTALVGKGHFGASLESPSLKQLPVDGRVLAFNARTDGQAAILLHIHASNPVEATVVLVFKISHPRSGKFGTMMTTNIPSIASDLGYVTDISLTFGRKYRVDGEQRSLISARCAAPAGFPGALFTFARGVFRFAGGKQVTTTLARDCVVR
jgi:hypothetical protein